MTAKLLAMKFIVRGIVYGFAFSVGAALFKKVAGHIGLAEESKEKSSINPSDAATDSGLQHKFS